MKNIKIFYKHSAMTGVMTSMIDMYNNLQSIGIDAPIDIALVKNAPIDNIKRLIDVSKKYSFYFNVLKDNKISADIIISSCQYFMLKYYSNQKNVDIKCEKLILLDSTCFMGALELEVMDKLLSDMDNFTGAQEIIILCNKANYNLLNGKFKKVKLIEYYHSFSDKRLDVIQTIQYKNEIIHSEQYEDMKKTGRDVHTFAEYHYNRWFYLPKIKQYYENIGKCMFEFAIIGKKSFYNPKNITMYDGLSSYLEYIGLNENESIALHEHGKLLYDKFSFDENDTLVKLLRD